jgi:hypothetical protein
MDHQGIGHGLVAIGRFDQQLGLVFAPRALRQPGNGLGTFIGSLGQIALEGKALPVQATGHQPQQQR